MNVIEMIKQLLDKFGIKPEEIASKIGLNGPEDVTKVLNGGLNLDALQTTKLGELFTQVTGQKLGDVADMATGALGGIAGAGKDGAAGALGGLGDIAGKVGDLAGDAADKGKDAAGAAADKAKDAAEPVKKKGFFARLFGK